MPCRGRVRIPTNCGGTAAGRGLVALATCPRALMRSTALVMLLSGARPRGPGGSNCCKQTDTVYNERDYRDDWHLDVLLNSFANLDGEGRFLMTPDHLPEIKTLLYALHTNRALNKSAGRCFRNGSWLAPALHPAYCGVLWGILEIIMQICSNSSDAMHVSQKPLLASCAVV